MIIHKLPQKLTNFSWSQLACAKIVGAKLLGNLTENERNANFRISITVTFYKTATTTYDTIFDMCQFANCKYEPKVKN